MPTVAAWSHAGMPSFHAIVLCGNAKLHYVRATSVDDRDSSGMLMVQQHTHVADCMISSYWIARLPRTAI